VVGAGVLVRGADLTIETSVVRGTQPYGDGESAGIEVYSGENYGMARIHGSLLEGNQTAGVYADASYAELIASVVRGSWDAADNAYGAGVRLGPGASAKVEQSVLSDNQGIGLNAWGADVTVDASVVRDTMGGASASYGYGIAVGFDESSGARSTLALSRSALIRNEAVGLAVVASDAVVEFTRIRDTVPSNDASSRGVAIAVQNAYSSPERGKLTLASSVVERSQLAGVVVYGSDALLTASEVVDTAPRDWDGRWGWGILVWGGETPGTAKLQGAAVERNVGIGVAAFGADVVLEDTTVGQTQPEVDGLLGDGVLVSSIAGVLGTAFLDGARIEDNARAGVASFGGHVHFGGTLLECNALDLDGEPFEDAKPIFADAGENRCGCGKEQHACQALTTGLLAPDLSQQ